VTSEAIPHTTEHLCDDDEILLVTDVTSGAVASDVEALIALHLETFPDHGFIAEEIRRDAALERTRDGVVVHQWLVRVDDCEIAYMLVDCNLVRRVALVHFVAVNAGGRALRIAGERISSWLVHEAERQLQRDLLAADRTEAGFGVIGEALERKVRLWSAMGFRSLPVEYAEPIHGRHWRRLAGLGADSPDRPGPDEVRSLALLWLPAPHVVDVQRSEAELIPCALSAFLVDHYGFDPGHRLVRPAGDEATRHAAHGR